MLQSRRAGDSLAKEVLELHVTSRHSRIAPRLGFSGSGQINQSLAKAATNAFIAQDASNTRYQPLQKPLQLALETKNGYTESTKEAQGSRRTNLPTSPQENREEHHYKYGRASLYE